MAETEILISAPALADYIERILRATGVPGRGARLAADNLVAGNLRGVDSHGVQLLIYYVQQLEAGDMDPRAEGRVVSENGCAMVYDGENGVGQLTAEICTQHAIRIAREYGMSLVTARECNHFGMAAYWAQKMADAGQVGIVLCNASSIVPPWQGRQPRLGTNPICMAVPGPWLLDMATTTVAMGKIYKAMFNGEPVIPAGWALDKEGAPTTDTKAAFHGMPMPLGGYKGSGLAMMVEILCSVLSAGAMRKDVGGIRLRGRRLRVSHTFLGIDVARFMPVEEFRARVEELVRHVKNTPPAPGYDEVLVAGDPEWRMEAERLRDGIPVGKGTWDTLGQAAARLGVAVPEVCVRAGIE
ncbi:MAG: Ldh family oxidoreductase [Bryobacteraceae bacterium]